MIDEAMAEVVKTMQEAISTGDIALWRWAASVRRLLLDIEKGECSLKEAA